MPASLFLRVIGFLAALVFGVMTQTDPEGFVSNISKWWSFIIGTPPEWIREPLANDVATGIAAIIAVILIIPLAKKLWRSVRETQFPKADLIEWRNVEPLLLWQAGCLWKGIKPVYPVVFLNPAYRAFSMILRAAEHGHLPLVKRESDQSFAYSQVARSELAKFAAAKGEAPEFLRDLMPSARTITAARTEWLWYGAGLVFVSAIGFAVNQWEWVIKSPREFLTDISSKKIVTDCDAKLEKITEGGGDLPDGRRLIARVYRVVPSSGPPVMKLTFEARGGGVSDINIKSRDPKRFNVFEEVIISGGKAEAIQNPRGMYEVTVIGSDPDSTKLDSKFECE